MEDEAADLAEGTFVGGERRAVRSGFHPVEPPGEHPVSSRGRRRGLAGDGEHGHVAEPVQLARLDRALAERPDHRARPRHEARDQRHEEEDRDEANHHDPKTSNRPRRQNSSPTTGWSVRYRATRSGLFGICGRREPVTDARARRSKRISAVRIERKDRHATASERRNVGRAAEVGAEEHAVTRCYCGRASEAPRTSGADATRPSS